MPKTFKVFGKEYLLIGNFSNPEDLTKAQNNLKKAGHSTMIKNQNYLYATQFKVK